MEYSWYGQLADSLDKVTLPLDHAAPCDLPIFISKALLVIDNVETAGQN